MFFLFDIGGTKMRFAISDGNNIDTPKIVPTPESFDEALNVFGQVFHQLKGDSEASRVVGGIAGVFDKEKTKLVASPNLSEWIGKPLKEGISKIVGSKVFLENDAALAGLGEATYGAGHEASIVAYITVGTGVGGARIVDGKIDRKSVGFEPGHQAILIEEKEIVLENLISGKAIKSHFGKSPEEIKDEKIQEGIEKYLAFGLNNSIVHWSPDIVVLGGGLVNSDFIRVEKVALHLNKVLKIFPEVPPIVKSKLGELSGLYGALDLAQKS